MTGRIAESVRALNSLGRTSAVDVRRGHFIDGHQSCGKPTRLQSAVLRRLSSRVVASGACPTGMTPKSCFEDVIKSKDMYSLSQSSVAPFNLDLLKVTKTSTVPKPAVQLLPETEAKFLENPEEFLIRSPEEIARWSELNPNFQPYWDETLRTDREARHSLYEKLVSKSLLGFRRRIRAKVGLFFVWKSGKKGIRMIVDARMPNGFHRRPPKTKLGGAAAISELDAFVDEADSPVLAEGYGGPVELPCSLFGCTGDVSDAFYQFSVESLADWFGLDDPVEARRFSVSSVWDPDLGKKVAVKPDELLYPVFLGMPQGWAWALHFCNTAVEYGMSHALPATQFVKEGMPAPDLRLGPVGSVYVDNIGVFGLMEKVCNDSFDSSVECLERAGFVLHELDKGSVEVTNVGIVLHRDELKIRHTKKRSWRLYLALKHVLQMRCVTSEALRVIVGHIVHYFSLMRSGLSTLHHTYKFVHKWLDGRAHVLPGCVKRELRMVVGLIFQVEKDLAAAYSDKVYCGDSSSYGFCFQWTPSTATEQRDLFRFHERWRFVEVEEGIGLGLGTHHSWSADLDVPDIAYARWLRQRLGLPQLSSGVLDKGGNVSRADGRQFQTLDLVGMVPRLPDDLVRPERWNTVVQRKWKHNEPIHMKEGRVALMSLRRESRSLGSHGKKLLTLCDNLSAVCAFDRGRAKDLSLLSLCRRSCALQVATGIQWHLRYIESGRNPSDEGSRVFDGERWRLKEKRSQRSALPLLHPLPSSSCPARLHRQTATHGRGCGSGLGAAMRINTGATMAHECKAGSEWRSLSLETKSSPSSRIVPQSQALKQSAKTHSSTPTVATSFLELFSGSSRLTSAISMRGLRVATPFDLRNGSCFDLTKRGIQRLIKQWICSGRIWYLHLGTPCTYFSVAKNHKGTSVQVRRALKCVHFTAELIRLCGAYNVFFSLENPKTSKLFLQPCIRRALHSVSAWMVEYDCCRYGCPYKKPSVLATNCEALHSLGKRCVCQLRKHEHLRGRVKLEVSPQVFKWFWKTSLAGEYPGELCHAWAGCINSIAPLSAQKTQREPEFLSGWLDEICQVTRSIIPTTLVIEPCPRHASIPWCNAVDTWGTGSSSRGKGQTEEGNGH